MNIRSSSAWNENQIESFLRDTVIPIRLACVTQDGSPLVCSLWYIYIDGTFWLGTQKTAAVVSYLESEPRCGLEVAPETPPYKGVRGQGKATLSAEQGPEVLSKLINRYLGGPDSDFAQWLLSRSDSEIAIGIRPSWLTSWDFSTRMR